MAVYFRCVQADVFSYQVTVKEHVLLFRLVVPTVL